MTAKKTKHPSLVATLAGCFFLAFPILGNATPLYPTDGARTNTPPANRPPLTERIQFNVELGTDHKNEQRLHLEQLLTDSIGFALFGEHESSQGVDYDDNDVERKIAGIHLQHHTFDTQLNFVALHQEKEFGARGYYGENAALPAHEKTKDTLLSLTALRGDLNNDYFLGGVSWHEFQSDYSLPTLGFRNQTRSRISSAFFNGRTLEVNGFALGWETDLLNEQITGDLGDHHRTRGGVSLLPQWKGDKLKIVVGARGEFFTDESSELLPQLGLDYLLSDNLTAFASYSETVRLPTYTERNYNAPGSVGNTALDPQKSAKTEIGLKGIPSETMDWKIAVFHRRSKNTIDWMKATAAGRWKATDIGTLDVYGLETQLGWYPAQNIEMQLSYIWIYKDQEASDIGGYASRYALDYPEHLAKMSLLWHPFQSLELGTTQTLRYQTDNKVRVNGNFGADSSFVVRYTPPCADYATISLLLNNAWDDDFQPLPGQRASERYAGISLTLDW